MKQPEEEFLKVSEVFDYDFKQKRGTFEWYECENCGKIVFSHGVRIKDSKKLCITCARIK